MRSFNVKRKNRWKTIRTIAESALILAALYALISAWFLTPEYRRYYDDASAAVANQSEENGFVALSYFGVEKYDSFSRSLIPSSRLEQHIAALKASGYVTITQQDILAFYKEGKKLPGKALFLLFEDGLKDSAIFAQDILQKYNFKASMITYANTLETRDTRFLMPQDLKTLLRSSYWEMGTNGYRLEYINVFDRYDNYFGHLTSPEFVKIASYLDRDYNHYLMDFIRDEDGVPLETPEEMRKRIAFDYQAMADTYLQKLGFLPRLYVLLHSNTGQFGTHDLVSAENAKLIPQLFQINFNREGYSYNVSGSSIYDLTRMEPQASWYVNHLLMRIQDDTGQDVAFVSGDAEKKSKWDTLTGESEFKENVIALTSLPSAAGFMRLRSIMPADVNVTLNMKGNKAGIQSVYLRADGDMQNYICVSINNNVLSVSQCVDGTVEELSNTDLFKLNGDENISVKEEEHQGLLSLSDAILQYNSDSKRRQEASDAKEKLLLEAPQTVAEGASPYIPEIDLLDRGSRAVQILLNHELLTVRIDNQPVLTGALVSVPGSGYLCLESAPIRVDTSQRNIYDDVYDGVFEDLLVQKPLLYDQAETVYYSNKELGLQGVWADVRDVLQKAVNWFMEIF